MPYARSTDPETSHLAAASVKRTTVKQIQAHVLYLLDRHPQGLSDEWLVRLSPSNMPPSSIRTRRSELVNMGKVTAHPTRRGTTAAGRSCTIWILAPEQRLFEVE